MTIGLIEDPSWGRSGAGRGLAQRGFTRAFVASVEDGLILADSEAARRWLDTVLSPQQRRRVRPRAHWPARQHLDVVQTIGEPDDRIQRACVRAGSVPVAYGTHGFPIDPGLNAGQAARLFLCGMAPHDAVVCTSRAMQRGWAALLGMFDPRRFGAPLLPFIPWGVDAEALRPEDPAAAKCRLGLDPHRLTVGFLGRLSVASKADLLPLVRAVSRLPDAPTLVVAGPEAQPGYVDAITNFAASLSMQQPCVLGPVAPAERRHVLGAMDVVVCLSDLRGEGQGLAPLDAMACGRPVVASAWAGYRDSVVHGETGFVVPTFTASCSDPTVDASPHRDAVLSQAIVTDPAALSQAIERLVSDAQLRAAMGSAGRARVLSEYAWPTILARYQALWREQIAIRRAAKEDTEATRASWIEPQASVSSEALLSGRASITALGRAQERLVPVHAQLDAHIDPTCIDRLLDALSEGPRTLADLVGGDDPAGLRHALFLAKHGFITVAVAPDPD